MNWFSDAKAIGSGLLITMFLFSFLVFFPATAAADEDEASSSANTTAEPAEDAADGETAAQSAAKEDAKEDAMPQISFSGRYTRARMVEGSEEVELSGDAWIETGGTRIEADEIQIYGENFRYARCTGNVIVRDDNQEITLYCTSLSYDRETSTSEVSGWVEMEDRRNELIARGAYMKNNGEEGISVIQIAARIIKDTDKGQMLCRTDTAEYNSKERILVLLGNSSVYWNDDTYKASKITIDLETNDIELEGNVSGTIYK